MLLLLGNGLRQGPGVKPLPGAALRELGRRQHIVTGTAVRADVLSTNRGYRQLIDQEFGSITPENEMKWNAVEPRRGEFHFDVADYMVDQAEQARQVVRGHALIFEGQLPDWVNRLGTKDLAVATTQHINRVMGRYRGRIATWDVVNEGITDDGRLKRTVFLRRLGPGYFAAAFKVARHADPSAKLYINEIGAEAIGPKSNRLYRLVRELKAAGVPIDGVGFQAHLTLAGLPPTFVANMRRFAALGVEIAISEADVAVPLPASEAELRRQAAVYADVVRSCRAVTACRRLTVWGYTDGRSWISEGQAGVGAATLLDARFRPKPAFYAVQRGLAR